MALLTKAALTERETLMSRPPLCPYCRSFDLRSLTPAGVDLHGFRCHDCSRTFYLTASSLLNLVTPLIDEAHDVFESEYAGQ